MQECRESIYRLFESQHVATRGFTPCWLDAQYPKPVVNISWVWMPNAFGIWTLDTSMFPLCPSFFHSFSTFPSPLLFSHPSEGFPLPGSNRIVTSLSLRQSFMPATATSLRLCLLSRLPPPSSIFSTSCIYSHWSPIVMTTHRWIMGAREDNANVLDLNNRIYEEEPYNIPDCLPHIMRIDL